MQTILYMTTPDTFLFFKKNRTALLFSGYFNPKQNAEHGTLNTEHGTFQTSNSLLPVTSIPNTEHRTRNAEHGTFQTSNLKLFKLLELLHHGRIIQPCRHIEHQEVPVLESFVQYRFTVIRQVVFVQGSKAFKVAA